MPPRRNKEKFQQHTEFERGRIIGLLEGGFFYHARGTRVQPNSSTVMRVWKQGTDKHRTTRKTGSGRRKLTLARDDQHLLRMSVNDRTASSRQTPLTANHRRLRLQWAHEHRAWQGDWLQVVFSDESRLNLRDHDDRIRVRRYDGECFLPECVIDRHSSLTPGVMVWGVISYHGRSNLLRI
ncbi:transposable element Tc1 transposase [Trichonephila clavipes]|nr:transposable element Tc1 transposase [Trichonephila clavipes]